MAGRYELSDQRWHMIEDIFSPPQTMGRPRRDDRQMLDGILWILCPGAQWRDDGTFDRVLTRLHLRLREDGYMDLDTWMVDSTSIRATRSASSAGKKGGSIEPSDHALGRSRDGLTTKIHLLCDGRGFPLTFSPAGQRADSTHLTKAEHCCALY